MAAVHAIKDLAKEPALAEVIAAYDNVDHLEFGADYIIPKPLDPRLMNRVATAVAKAAIDTGVARINCGQSTNSLDTNSLYTNSWLAPASTGA